jgi:hypothetical protein
MLTTILSLLAAAALWLVYEFVGTILGEILWMVLGPVLRPIGRLASRLLSGRTVTILWMGALASYAFLPWSADSPSRTVRILALVAFMALTPLALMGTFSLRGRRASPGLRGRAAA